MAEKLCLVSGIVEKPVVFNFLTDCTENLPSFSHTYLRSVQAFSTPLKSVSPNLVTRRRNLTVFHVYIDALCVYIVIVISRSREKRNGHNDIVK